MVIRQTDKIAAKYSSTQAEQNKEGSGSTAES